MQSTSMGSSTVGVADVEALKYAYEQAKISAKWPTEQSCPRCGYCPACGRGGGGRVESKDWKLVYVGDSPRG